MQSLGLFKRTELGLEGRIRTLYIDLILCVIKANCELRSAESNPDYIIKSKYSTLGYGWNEAGDVNEDGSLMSHIRLEFREPFIQTSFSAMLSQRENDWVMEWDSSPPEYTPFPLPPFVRTPHCNDDFIEHCQSKMEGNTHGT